MISWIIWDPNPVLFTLPWVNKPVVWYGVFFALGFYLAYQLAIRLIRRYFYLTPHFSLSDVRDWDLFREDICYKREGYIILSELQNETKQALFDEKVWTEAMRQDVLQSLNATFVEKELQIRGVTEHEKKETHTLAEEPSLVVHRLSLEHQFKGVFYSFAEKARACVDALFVYVFLGTLIGARLGHLLFYRAASDYLTSPLELIAVWGGGLSSHGALIGIVVSLLLFTQRSRRFSLLRVLDFIVAPTALCGVFIRIGNFFNQEILGIPTTMPWGVVFGHPMDGSLPTPRHPVQLYEACMYAVVFGILLVLWKKKQVQQEGVLSGVFFLGVFGARFLLEFYKETLGVWDGTFPLLTGQLLSLPLVCVGLILLTWKWKKRERFL